MCTEKAHAFLACLLHYYLSIANPVWLLGNNYTGAYPDIPGIAHALWHHSINEKLIAKHVWVMTVGGPNNLIANTTRDNALLYWCQANYPSIAMCINNVMATMNKEECNNYLIHLPHWRRHFVPHCFITPQHILINPGKKDRRIFNALHKYCWDSVPIDSMTSTSFGSELHCKFGSVRDTILTCMYNLHITYPCNDIMVHDNDVKSCYARSSTTQTSLGPSCISWLSTSFFR